MTSPHATVHGSAAVAQTHDVRIGNRYRLEDRLGRGAMAEVFRAHDETLDRRVALKIFHPTDSAEERSRQQAEVAILAGLTHRNIVSAFDAGTDTVDATGAQCAFLVLELVAGCTLRAALADGPLEPHLVRRLALQLADAVAYVHGQGIVHRDLKPANLLLAPCPDDVGQTVVKLTDFGVAQVIDSPVTRFGESGGSANYVSPEQARGEDATRASDVYSLGLVLLECLTGRQAFPGEGTSAAVARLHRSPAVPAALGVEWVDLLTRMTATDPAQRPTALEVLRTVRAIGLPVAPSPVAPSPAALGAPRGSVADDARGPLDGVEWIAGASTHGRRARPLARHRARSHRFPQPRIVIGAAVAIIALVGALPLMFSIARATAGRPEAAQRPAPVARPTAGPGRSSSAPARPTGAIALADPAGTPPAAGFGPAPRVASTTSTPPASGLHVPGRPKPHKAHKLHNTHPKRGPKAHPKAKKPHTPKPHSHQVKGKHPHTK